MEKKVKKDADINIRCTRQERDNLKEYAARVGSTMTEVLLNGVDAIIHPEKHQP